MKTAHEAKKQIEKEIKKRKAYLELAQKEGEAQQGDYAFIEGLEFALRVIMYGS